MQVEIFSVSLLVNKKNYYSLETKPTKQISAKLGKGRSFSTRLPIEIYSAQNLPGSTLNGFICMRLTR